MADLNLNGIHPGTLVSLLPFLFEICDMLSGNLSYFFEQSDMTWREGHTHTHTHMLLLLLLKSSNTTDVVYQGLNSRFSDSLN